MMKHNIILIILLFTVFFIGFLSGSFWQALLQSRLQVSAELPAASSAETKNKNIGTENIDPVTPSQLTEEEQTTQALTDPDFKRVHDFLIRESPMQMNLESQK
ncbi:MAG: hypothetical protein LBF88_13630 [Planctomycetaceae bacterium]|jgi:hypothetical protein|nr:hypothetical protein [Planctomycetaceae bacterium]